MNLVVQGVGIVQLDELGYATTREEEGRAFIRANDRAGLRRIHFLFRRYTAGVDSEVCQNTIPPPRLPSPLCGGDLSWAHAGTQPEKERPAAQSFSASRYQ